MRGLCLRCLVKLIVLQWEKSVERHRESPENEGGWASAKKALEGHKKAETLGMAPCAPTGGRQATHS